MGSYVPRKQAVPLETLRGSLPEVVISKDVDHVSAVRSAIEKLESLDAAFLTDDALWRDLWALTGTSRTFYGSDTVSSAWKELADQHHPQDFRFIPGSSLVMRVGPDHAWIQGRFTFETSGSIPQVLGSGFIGIVPTGDGKWRMWLLSTVLEQIKGYPSCDTLEPEPETESTIPRTLCLEIPDLSTFDCVIVGAGMAGLSVAGRLKALGVSYVILEQNDDIGDNWINRYDSAKLHTIREYGHLPFSRTFPEEDPRFLDREDLARGYKKYVSQYGINVWLSTTLESASRNEKENIWVLNARQNGTPDVSVIHARHLVLATGSGQIPKMPALPNPKLFQGEVLHSVDYKSPEAWKGKKGVVIGSANTAHDVASDMLDAGLELVTMVQRKVTDVIPVEYLNHDAIYNTKIPTETADRIQFSLPIAVARQIAMKNIRARVDQEHERFDALERAGFLVRRYCDPFDFLIVRLGGHYLDVGCSAKISAGLIKMKSNVTPIAYTPTGLELSDGSQLDADVIVFCTGFEGNMRTTAASIIGQSIADRLEDFFGVDEEGEILGAWKPMNCPGIWYTGGAIGHARYFSRFVALQIKADVANVPLQQYHKTPV
ncbi:hypothetical protein N7510_004672 [Penicillium lagena]|uniref:uncharacterized protein n=1 Tax=Penicillium lagena TaxID=94218 RepID=UPI00254179E0|nr:uncharacterized protein N7510_004672 [Penicillium lagena]KAJ5620688.1 hypothetical protein N7510_004672 [Penicillium lagena]